MFVDCLIAGWKSEKKLEIENTQKERKNVKHKSFKFLINDDNVVKEFGF